MGIINDLPDDKSNGHSFDGNSSFLKGPALASSRIRLMDADGSANSFSEHGKEIRNGKTYVDLGDIAFLETSPQFVYTTIKQKIQYELMNSDKIICFGGDHSVSFPIIEAYAESLIQVGIRTLNTHQKEQAELFKVQVIEMKDFNYNFIKTLQSPLYISLDLDVLDPAFAPGISHHEPGGLTTRELINIIQFVTVSIVGADIVEYNPTRDINNMTAMVAYKLFKELVSKMID
jgi:arginase